MKILLPFIKNIAIVLFLLLSANLFSQTVYENYLDGEIWFKLKPTKENQLIYKKATRFQGQEQENNSNIKLASLPFLREVFVKYNVTRLSRPFVSPKSTEALLNTYSIEFSDIQNVDAFIRELEASGAIEYAEKKPIYETTLTPNDPFHNATQAWGLFKIQAEQAWNITTGSASIVVATVDNAIQITHPDLVNQIWTNPGEIPNNGIDDDGNGRIDDVNGYDVGDNDNNPNPPTTAFNHGTHVAGTTGAQTNNGTGVSSIGFGITIMPVKATKNSSGSNSVTNGYDGIFYAANSGADIINCSWGGTGFSTTGQNIVNFAWNNGSIVVAAAGNDNTNNDNTPHYPSNMTNVISVASSTTNDSKSSFSNYGNTVDITAPGSNIISTVPNNTYASLSGTSMASPLVSGLLGLMKSLNPTLPNTTLINCMYSSADNIDAVNPSFIGRLGAGRINALAALQCVSATLSNPPIADFSANFTTINAGSSVIFTDQSTFSPTTWSWNFDNQSLGGVVPATANTQGTHTVTYNNVGVYEVSLTVTNANGSDNETKTAYINVVAPGTCEIIDLDTTGTPFHFGWTPTLFQSQGGTPAVPNGFVSGTNGFGDKAKANFYNAAQIGGFNFVIGTYIWIGRAATLTPTKTVNINVYDGTTGSPGAILGTKTVTMAFILANSPGIPFIEFDNPIAIPPSGQIFVGVDFSNLVIGAGDTLAIVTNANNQSAPNTAWEMWSDNTWHDYVAGWNLNLSHYIFPWLTNTPTTINLSATPTTICAGEVVHYDATGSTFQDTLLWTFGGGVTPSNSNNIVDSIIYNTPGTYTTFLEVIGGGCSRYRIDSVTITVNPTPTISITSTADTICSGSSVTLTASGAMSYVWSPGGQTTSSIVVSPTSTTSYNVNGTSSGCTGNGFLTIVVDSLPTVANASFTPTSGICLGENIQFDGTGSTNANTYSWSFSQGSPSITSSTLSQPVVSFGAPGTHNYSLTITSSCGTNTFNGSITINPSPTVTASATATSICSGSQVILTGGGATSYTWDNGVTNAVAFTPTATTNYTVTGTDVNGCTNTAQVMVTVNPLPTVTANASAMSVCAGTQVTLTGGGAASYTWNNGVTNGVAFTPTATTTYTVTGTDANGCQNSAQVTVTVTSGLTVTANASATNLCLGDQVTLTGSGATSYTWDNGVTNGIPFTPPLGVTVYSVVGTSGTCSGNDVITLTVNALPTVTASSSASVVCAGNQVTLSSISNGNAPFVESWTNGVIGGVPFIPTATTTYTVTSTDANGCQNTDQIIVSVNPLPTVTANATSTSICAGTQVTLTGSGATSYTWDNGVIDGLAFTPPATTTYTVTGTDANGCQNTAQVTVAINQLPTANATFTPNTNICENMSVQFDASTSTGATGFNWSFPQGSPSISSSTLSNPVVSFASLGTHNYALIVTNACGTNTFNGTIFIDICNSINEHDKNNGIVTYFNSFSNLVELTTKNIPFGTYDAMIINALGQVVITKNIVINVTEQKIQLPLNSEAKGLYIIKLINNENNYSTKFIK